MFARKEGGEKGVRVRQNGEVCLEMGGLPYYIELH